jgi:hypothetical protein
VKNRPTRRSQILPAARHRFPLLSIVFLACSGGTASDRPPDERDGGDTPAAEAAALPDREEFVTRGLGIDAGTRESLRAALGEPDSLGAEVLPNRHVPGVMDTIYTVIHSDLTARIHHPGGGGDLLSSVEVSANRHLRYPVIGLDVARIDAAFGRPDEASDSSLTYSCTSCVAGDDPVQLLFAEGKVRRVRFNYYVD